MSQCFFRQWLLPSVTISDPLFPPLMLGTGSSLEQQKGSSQICLAQRSSLSLVSTQVELWWFSLCQGHLLRCPASLEQWP